LLDNSGDLMVSDTGDIALTQSVRQAVLVRLRWIYGEWRLGPEMGFPWFEEVFKKNPNTLKIRQLVREEILKVDGVTNAAVKTVEYDKERRTATFAYTVVVGQETYEEEVTLDG
jgi:hypothetical protein